jgi:hypothetical protein
LLVAVSLADLYKTRNQVRIRESKFPGQRFGNPRVGWIPFAAPAPSDSLWPFERIRKIAEARQFSQKLTDEVASSYLVEANRFGLINAFTNAAQKLGSLQQIEMERFAGTWLEAPLQ